MKEFLRCIEWVDGKGKLDYNEILIDVTIGIILPAIVIWWVNQ